jgi:hypothetical protein
VSPSSPNALAILASIAMSMPPYVPAVHIVATSVPIARVARHRSAADLPVATECGGEASQRRRVRGTENDVPAAWTIAVTVL